jgi:hypothetical protein
LCGWSGISSRNIQIDLGIMPKLCFDGSDLLRWNLLTLAKITAMEESWTQYAATDEKWKESHGEGSL